MNKRKINRPLRIVLIIYLIVVILGLIGIAILLAFSSREYTGFCYGFTDAFWECSRQEFFLNNLFFLLFIITVPVLLIHAGLGAALGVIWVNDILAKKCPAPSGRLVWVSRMGGLVLGTLVGGLGGFLLVVVSELLLS